MLFFTEGSWWGGGRGGYSATCLTEHGISCVKGSASAEAFGAARSERVGLDCRGRLTNARDLLSCSSAARSRRRPGSGGSGAQHFCHGRNRRYIVEHPSDTLVPGKCACCLGKSVQRMNRQSAAESC